MNNVWGGCGFLVGVACSRTVNLAVHASKLPLPLPRSLSEGTVRGGIHIPPPSPVPAITAPPTSYLGRERGTGPNQEEKENQARGCFSAAQTATPRECRTTCSLSVCVCLSVCLSVCVCVCVGGGVLFTFTRKQTKQKTNSSFIRVCEGQVAEWWLSG